MRTLRQGVKLSSQAYGPIALGLAGVVAVVVWVLPSSYTGILTLIGLYGLVTIGLNLFMGYAGQVSLGQAAFVGIGAYTSAALAVKAGLSPWLGTVAGALAAALAAYVLSFVALRLRENLLALATLALGIVINVVFNEWEYIGGSSGFKGIPGFSLAGHAFDLRAYAVLAWLLFALGIWFAGNLVRSSFGRALIAISAGELGAQALGVDGERLKRQTFVLSAVYAGVAGAVYASYAVVHRSQLVHVLALGQLRADVGDRRDPQPVGGARRRGGGGGAGPGAAGGRAAGAAQRARRLPAFFLGVILIAILILLPRGLDRPPGRGAPRVMASLWQYVLAGIVVGAIYALIAAGFVLIYQVTGLINFAQGEFAMIGAMTAASLATRGVPVLGAAALAVLVAAIVGALAYLLAIRPARGASGVTLIFITLGLDVALRGAGLIEWGTNPYALEAFSSGRAITLWGGVLPPQAAWVLGTDLLVFVALYLFFRHTYAGVAVRAAVANPPIASTFGIPLRTFAFWSFVVAAAIGGLGGVVVAPITQATYDMGLTLGLAGFVAAVLGGLESLPGALLGGFVLGIVQKVAGGLLSTGWEEGIGFLILVLVLVLRPQGLLGRAARRA